MTIAHDHDRIGFPLLNLIAVDPQFLQALEPRQQLVLSSLRRAFAKVELGPADLRKWDDV